MSITLKELRFYVNSSDYNVVLPDGKFMKPRRGDIQHLLFYEQKSIVYEDSKGR